MLFQIKLWILPVISPHPEAAVGVALLQDLIAGVRDIFKNRADAVARPLRMNDFPFPRLAVPLRANPSGVQVCRDLPQNFSGQCPAEDFLYDLRFQFIHSVIPIHQVIAVWRGGRPVGSVFKTLLQAPPAVCRDAVALILRQRCEDRQQEFRIHGARIDVLALKGNVCSFRSKAAHHLQQVCGVPRKPRYRFCQHQIDPACGTVSEEPLQLRPFLLLCTGNNIGVDPEEQPVFMLGSYRGKMLLLNPDG